MKEGGQREKEQKRREDDHHVVPNPSAVDTQLSEGSQSIDLSGVKIYEGTGVHEHDEDPTSVHPHVLSNSSKGVGKFMKDGGDEKGGEEVSQLVVRKVYPGHNRSEDRLLSGGVFEEGVGEDGDEEDGGEEHEDE